MAQRMRKIEQTFAAGSPSALRALQPRDDLVLETLQTGDDRAVFVQTHGPFIEYRREVTAQADGSVNEHIYYSLNIPWFEWLFSRPVRGRLAKRPPPGSGQPWWSPPDRMTTRQTHLLGLLSVAAMASVFTNTLFTQTSTFAARSFGVSESGLSRAGVAVRCGIVIAIPVTRLADRKGRRGLVVATAFVAPLVCALGALAPNFALLTAAQAVGRAIGLALAILIGVVLAEEMPRNSRAFALSLMTMAGGLGATVAVANLWMVDVAPEGWRLLYVLSLIWLIPAIRLHRELPETARFDAMETAKHVPVVPALRRERFVAVAAVSTLANLFVAPASFLQNEYLSNERGMTSTMVSIFTLVTATPAGLGLAAGGWVAEWIGRKIVLLVCLPLSTLLLVLSFASQGWSMWAYALLGGVIAGFAYPAFTVYRAEMFPTGNRSRANGLVTALALGGGAIGLVVVGELVGRGWSYGRAMAVVAVGQVVAAALAAMLYPETAHQELEALNPEDQPSPTV